MNKPLETLAQNLVGLGETIKVRVHRGLPDAGGYADAPDIDCDGGDLITNNGRTYIAQRIASNVASPMGWMAVGTASGVTSLTSPSTLPGEVDRKPLAVNSAVTNNVYTAVATWGGAADSVTSLQITEAAVLNHVGSGEGTMLQRVDFAAVTLADSDLLSLTLETNVGSNDI